ncbi:glycoside hydrolase family 72 protein [Aspergillus homomorphus CBS 101889]|uniref:1,3-beta-glucanosyltransferase n=1 Tax=Aspergillus homomorphus (strain CBS 101889) TaxID=1450537 RepID=A0A395HMK5_ASPHC|nr:putative 1,3-beta-glucanosyltransferase [Aspergillus homomorphus CBS 101889]RAL08729.1 putative 1,3-beta-glucanosyltransferase [Aspergillus homomorphus CBS 101889]
MKLSLALGAAVFVGSALADIDPIVIKGSKFFYSSNNTQFYIRGVAYQADYDSNSTDSSSSSYVDPLADATLCKRDIPILQEIRTNVIRTYAVDPTKNHTECMNMLAEAGIYVISDLSDPSESIDRDDPTWETSLYTRYKNVIDDLSQYNNTIGFFAGNEVSNTIDTTDASAFVKAAVRDMKAYIKAKGYRSMGVGYATNDDSDIRVNMADYFNCESEDVGVDFWGYNIYSWCGNSTYEESGYKTRTEQFSNYSVPVFFAEYGCNTPSPRHFTEIQALFGDEMNDVWSGGIVYMYFQTDNDYGLVSAIDSTSVSKLKDFTYYSEQIQSATPTGTNKASYTPTNTALQSCPTVGSKWQAKASPLPPTPNSELCSCMNAAAGCVVKDSVSSTKYATLFSEVCGYISCTGVFHNGTTGSYGDFGMCEPKQQLNWALNRYWESQNKGVSACSFGGYATTTAATTASTCSAMLSEAGTAGTGSVSSTATATGDSSSSSSTSSSDSSSSAGHITGSAMVGVGSLQLGAYVVTAVAAGLGMILL